MARLIWDSIKGPRILDLGCGPVHHLLSLFFPDASESVGVDHLPESLMYVRDRVESPDIEEAALRACELLHRALARRDLPTDCAGWVRERYRRITELRIADVTEPIEDYRSSFDSALQIGCFLSLDDIAAFRTATRHVASHLRDGGVFLSVGWLQNGFQPRPFRFNGRLSAELSFDAYCRELQSSGLHLASAGESTDLGEETRRMGYSSVVWARLVK